MLLTRRIGAILLAVLALAAPAAQAQSAPAPVRGAGALPDTIPIFPLDNLPLFPNVVRPYRIFEPRYKAMFEDALKGDRLIGMVQLRPGYEADYEGRPPVFAVGCAGEIVQWEQAADGTYNLLLRGLAKFRILSEDQRRPYRVAKVEVIPEEPSAEELAQLKPLRDRLVAIVGPGGLRPPREMSDEDAINTIAQWAMIDGARKAELLEKDGPLARATALVGMLETK